MFERLSMHQGAIGVILVCLIFIALFFVLQFIVPIILWIRRKFIKTAYTGQELLDHLVESNSDQSIKLVEKQKNWVSPYRAYKKGDHTFSLSKKTLESDDLNVVFKIFTSMVFAKEKRHKIFSFSWQLWILTALSILPYLFGLTILLLIFLPDPEIFKNIAGNVYYLPAEALGIISFILILIIGIWWTFALQPIELEFEEYLNKINNKALKNLVTHHYRLCSYLPFSWRTVI